MRLPATCRVLAVWAVVSIVGPIEAGDLDVLINEVHYNVWRDGAEGTDEFVELKNRGPTEVNIGGWQFIEGIAYTFPPDTWLAPGAFAVLSPSPSEAESRYGLEGVFGPYVGLLDNGGEVLTLADARGRLVNRIHYNDSGAWPGRPDGRGPSLEFIGSGTPNRSGRNDLGHLWKPSLGLDGTPGRPNSRRIAAGESDPPRGTYVGGIINEILPAEGAEFGFIELYNPLSTPLDLTGYAIVTDASDFAFAIPDDTVLAPGELLELDGAAMPFRIPELARSYLLLGDDIIDDLEIDPVAGTSFGRFPDGDNDSHVLDAPTPEAANAYTEDRSVVINEIHYHPPFTPPSGDCTARCSDRAQWLELHNPGTEAVDLTGWRLTRAISYTFDGVSIPAGGFLVVAADIAEFSSLHPGVANVVGDWIGRLSHSSETIVLRNALNNPVDRVEYGDGGPLNDEDPSDGINDRTLRVSFWPPQADGNGPTLELIHPGVSNRAGVSWRESSNDGGTPGAQNSRFDASPSPSIRDVEHAPAVPTSSQPVVVTCRISAARPITNATVRWAVDGGGSNGTVGLVDDGVGVDERAGDGKYSAELPPRADGTIVRFSIEVADADNQTRRVPLEPQSDPYGGYPGTFYLYEVDNDPGPSSDAPVYRIVMKAADVNELRDRPVQSNVLLPATFIADDRAFHLVGVRYRGENSRNLDNRSLKVRFPAERDFDGIDNLNLNAGNGGQFDVSGFREILASDLFRRADVPYFLSWPISVHFPGEVDRDFDRRYIHKEAYDNDFLRRYFGGSDDGAFYRPRDPFGGGSGDLSYVGEDPDDYRDIYEKRSHEEEDDFSDVIELCRLFDRDETPAAEFASSAEALIDTRQWARFFAVMACLSNTDGGIWNRSGEDYFLYRVPADSPRPDAGKWLLLPWDLEECFQDSDEVLFRSTVPAIERLFSVPENARLYYEELRLARDGPFSRLQMRQRYDPADRMFATEDVFNVVDPIDTNITNRIGFIDSEVSWSIEAAAVGGDAMPGVAIIDVGATWRYFRGTEQPAGGGIAWTTLGYDDSSWQAGPSGFGYGDNDDNTQLGDMRFDYSTVFARRTFNVEDPNAIVALILEVDYDDAYVAYLNGSEIARSTTAPNEAMITFDMTATGNHEASGGSFGANPPEVTDVSAYLGLLQDGTNVLAIVGLNDELTSSDFSLIPSLSVSAGGVGGPAGGCGTELYAQGSIIQLGGVCDPVSTRSVTINGTPTPTTLIIGGNGPWGARWSADVEVDAGGNVVTLVGRTGTGGTGSVVESQDVFIERVSGFESVSGQINSAVTWTAADGPYRMTGNVTVTGTGSLTIEPGTVILADGDASIIVRGELSANGEESDPIRFLAYRCESHWGGIAFDDTGTSPDDPVQTLQHVRIRNGSLPNGFAGCVAAVGSRVHVADSEISFVPNNAIDATGSLLEVDRTHIHDIFEGVHCTSSTTRLSDCTIERMIGNSDAIDFDGSGNARSVIERCVLRASSDDGIDLGSVSVDIRDNVLIDIGDKAISVESPGAQGSPTITGNLVYRSGSGMAIKNGIDVSEGWHNTVANCQEGIWLFAKDDAPDGGHGSFHSVIAWQNGADLIVDARSSADFEFSNVGTGPALPGSGNIATDPQFVRARDGNYALRTGSPCRGTGAEGEDMGVIFSGGPIAGTFLRGDVNDSGSVDLSDVVALLNFLFLNAPGPESCLDIIDANDDGFPDISDAVFTLRYLFVEGDIIPAPFPSPGIDPTADAFECQ